MAGDGFASPLLSLVDKGVGLLLGTVDDHDVPRGTRAWGVRVLDHGVVRVTFGADDEVVVANVTDGIVAITGADVRDLRSAQLKGRVRAVAEPDDADLAAVAFQTEQFFRAIHETDLHDFDLLRRIMPTRMLTAEVEVSDAYDQTPGPSAGTPLADATSGGQS